MKARVLSGLLLLASAASAAGARLVSATPHRMEDGGLAFKVVFDGPAEPRRVRLYLDVDGPVTGELVTGADYLVEEGVLHRYPRMATGWTWDVMDPVAVLVEGEQAVFLLPPLDLPARGAWMAETVSAEFEVEDRFPDAGMTEAVFEEWPLFHWETPLVSEDVTDLLAVWPAGLSSRFAGLVEADAWEPIPDAALRLLDPPGLELEGWILFRATLTDAVTGRSGALRPDQAARSGDKTLWSGTTLGVAWSLLLDQRSPRDLAVAVELKDSRERFVSLALGLHVPLTGGTWCDDLRFSRTMDDTGRVYSVSVPVACGRRGRQSLVPWGVVSLPRGQLSVESAPGEPRVFEIAAEPGRSFFGVHYDAALTPRTSNFPGRAAFEANFHAAAGAPSAAYRRAVAAFYGRYPEYFKRRAPVCGFGRPPAEPGFPATVGFACDGDSLLRADGGSVMTCLFMEPWTYHDPATLRADGEEATRRLRLLSAGSGTEAKRAAAALVGGVRRADGTLDWHEETLPWHAGLALRLTTQARLPVLPDTPLNPAMLEWRRFKAEAGAPGVQGVYLEEAPSDGRLNHDPAALAVADHPAVYCEKEKKPGLPSVLENCAYAAALSAAARERGRLLAGPLTPVSQAFMARHLDLLGGVFDAWPGEGFDAALEASANLLRALAGTRPVTVRRADPSRPPDAARAKAFMEWCLFRAFLPSFFDRGGGEAWWTEARTNTVLRGLMATYLPLIRRLAGAGWRPEGPVDVAPEAFWHEQYGNVRQAYGHLAVRNTVGRRIRGSWTLPPAATRAGPVIACDPLTGECQVDEGEDGRTLPLTLLPWQIAVRDWAALAETARLKDFYRDWAGGDREGKACLANLEAAEADLAFGALCNVFLPTPAVRGDRNEAVLEVRNQGSENLVVSDIKLISSLVYRPLDGVTTNLPPGERARLTVEFEADDLEGDPWLEMQWTLARGADRRTTSRLGRPAVMDPFRVDSAPRRVEGKGERVYIDVQLLSLSNRSRPLTVQWQGDFKSGRESVEAAPDAETLVRLPIERRRAREGEVLVEITSEGAPVFRQWYDVVLR